MLRVPRGHWMKDILGQRERDSLGHCRGALVALWEGQSCAKDTPGQCTRGTPVVLC